MSEKSRAMSLNQLRLFAEASRARMSPPLANEMACEVIKVASGTSFLESLAPAARSGSLSRTSREECGDGSTPFVETWDGSTMRAYRSRLKRVMSGLRILGPEFSLWPTVVVTDQASSGRATTLANTKNTMKPGTSLTDAMRDWLIVSRRHGLITRAGEAISERAVLNPEFCQAMMGFPEGWLDDVSPPSGTRSFRRRRK